VEDFVREGEGLAEKNQALVALDPTYFEILLRQQGTDLFDESGKAFPDMQTAIDTLNWIRDLQEKKIGVLPERASIFDPVFFSSMWSRTRCCASLARIGMGWTCCNSSRRT